MVLLGCPVPSAVLQCALVLAAGWVASCAVFLLRLHSCSRSLGPRGRKVGEQGAHNIPMLPLAAGLGSLFGAGMYEVGRPRRLTVEQAQEKERQWQDFGEAPVLVVKWASYLFARQWRFVLLGRKCVACKCLRIACLPFHR